MFSERCAAKQEISCIPYLAPLDRSHSVVLRTEGNLSPAYEKTIVSEDYTRGFEVFTNSLLFTAYLEPSMRKCLTLTRYLIACVCVLL